MHDPAIPSRILVSGASGLIGSFLLPALRGGGGEVFRLVRPPAASAIDAISWDPDRDCLDSRDLEGFDTVIHLCGVNLADRRWSAGFKAALHASRVHSTRLLCERLSTTRKPPRQILCASAVGYYGNRGEEPLNEQSAAGSGFLADLCREWEVAAEPARQAGIRVQHLRLGVVLSRRGGMLGRLLPFFRNGLGLVIGSGRQYLSWISMRDLIRAVLFLLRAEMPSGAVNVVAPQPATNREFTITLARLLRRPVLLKAPTFAISILLGEMGREMLLAGQRAYPERLLAAGFQYECPNVADALRAELERT